MRLIWGTGISRINHEARINHDNWSDPPLSLSVRGPVIVVVPGMAGLHLLPDWLAAGAADCQTDSLATRGVAGPVITLAGGQGSARGCGRLVDVDDRAAGEAPGLGEIQRQWPGQVLEQGQPGP
jgi:hypothetical protein